MEEQKLSLIKEEDLSKRENRTYLRIEKKWRRGASAV